LFHFAAPSQLLDFWRIKRNAEVMVDLTPQQAKTCRRLATAAPT
jgi:hypothetical protein